MSNVYVIEITVPEPDKDSGTYIDKMYFHKMPSKLELISVISEEWKDQNPEKWTRPIANALIRTVLDLEIPEEYANLTGWFRTVGESCSVSCNIEEVR